jgi:sporulation protein YlmC with PRC-barrel domain
MTEFRVLAAVLAATTFLALGLPARAQAPASAAAALTPAERHDWERLHRLSRIIGTEVRLKSGDKVGDIRDLVIDDNGAVRLAIVSTGGLLGVGDRLHAVPWDLLVPGMHDDRILDIDKARLKDAPGFTSRTWPNLRDERWLAENRRFFVH